MRLRLVLLALLGALLATVGPTSPAVSAAAVPCARTWSGEAKAIAPEDPANTPAYKWTVAPIDVPASSDVEDIDVTYDLTHPHAANVMTRLTRMEGKTVTGSIAIQPRLTADTSSQARPLTFDDEATSAYAATSPTGRYRPAAELSAFDGTPAGATWRLDIAN
ncbi:hypothetical protein [Nocardioides currus]|uniref:P/Homo B domain-containing protein n=1 Tax=Nocardioides currus TaxID=2133958 RepID=A0A2R7Z1J0_9ACTN|nr:hypothetical protein [Nocardioides currus]PUA82482.1 hypothetical protein C7S10_01670 [Nocardioides currus]